MGILYFLQIFFVKVFDPSNWEGIFLGPKTLIPLFSKKSTTPFTNGFSGPTITKSTLDCFKNFKTFSKSSISKSIFSASCWVPAFPGRQYILLAFEDREIVLHIACSLPPLPMIQIIIYKYIST